MPNKPPRPCSHPGCPNLNCTVHVQPTRRIDTRPSPTQRGYGYGWQKRRAAFIQEHPYCEDCGEPATDVDHIPSRKALLAQGVSDPDDERYLHPRCHSCHSKKTNAIDGGGWKGRDRGGKCL